MNRKALLMIIIAIIVFAVSASVYSINYINSKKVVAIGENNQNNHQNSNEDSNFLIDLINPQPKEVASPYDRIKEEQIHVYNDKVVIELNNAEWASFTNTNSMDPVLDEGANAIEVVPKSYNEIHAGDIVSYKSSYVEGTIIHRVKSVGYDPEGWYAIMQGDNNPTEDPEKVRFEQIRRIVVAIIY
jgi:hypothetical protein